MIGSPVSSRHVMSKYSQKASGFTLIEITMVLVLLGILAAVAVPKFFDLQEEAEQKAVLAAAAEVQARMEATFGAKVLDGSPCSEARTFAASLANLADDGTSKFGEFSFQTSGDRDGSLGLKYSRGSDEWKDVAGFSLVLPVCSEDAANGFSATASEAFNALMANQTGYTAEDENYSYYVNPNGSNRVSLAIVSKTGGDGYYVHIARNTAGAIDTIALNGNFGPYPSWGKNLMRSLPNGVTPEQRNEQIEIFKTLCPNFDDWFAVESQTKNGLTYNSLVVKADAMP